MIFFVIFIAFTAVAIWRYAVPYFFPKTETPKVNNIPVSAQVNNTGSFRNDINKPQTETDENISTEWCVTGRVKRFNVLYILLKDNAGRLRMVPSAGFKGDGLMLEGIVDGKKVVAWSCNPVVSGASKGVL
ncbi:hypothetical protein DWD63_24930 [Salmonella enterica]|nr:hypothetical protein [Salmonella enterica]